MLQELFARMIPPANNAAAGVTAVPSAQVFMPFEAPNSKPAGRVSLNVASVSGTELGLLNVNVKVVVPPKGNAGAPNALVIVGALLTTRVAVAGAPGGASSVINAEVVFTFTPAVVLDTV